LDRSLWAVSGSGRRSRRGLLGVAILAAAFSASQPLAQTRGCARCGAAPPPTIAASQVPAAQIVGSRPQRPSFAAISREERTRETQPGAWREKGATRAGAWRGGSYFVCVRACDGGFFPVPYVGDTDSLAKICQALCPNADVQLYSMPFGGTIDEATSTTGQPYSQSPNASEFEQAHHASCSCRRPGESWAEALANAEARYGSHSHDIVVTPELSEQMSRPIQDPKPKRVEIDIMNADAVQTAEPSTTVEQPPTPDLDVDGVDTRLTAAAAEVSRESSGIGDSDEQEIPHYGLNQGRIVEQADRDGSTKWVRIIAPML
jgi:Protein of unknown function (DUF2865)